MNEDRIALFAGAGILPVILAERLIEKNILSLLIVLQGEKERFDSFNVKFLETPPGKIKRIIRALSLNNINKALMIGKIDKRAFIERKGFDLTALKLLKKMKDGKDLTIFHLIEHEFSARGIEILPQDKYLEDMIISKGTHSKRSPSKNEMTDAAFGIDHARKLASMEIGQTVVVKNQSITAVEALEGTSETILRGGRLSGKGSVVCKAARTNQDRRFDIPAVGIETLETMAKYGCSTLALEAGKILMVDKIKTIKFANSNKIAIIGL